MALVCGWITTIPLRRFLQCSSHVVFCSAFRPDASGSSVTISAQQIGGCYSAALDERFRHSLPVADVSTLIGSALGPDTLDSHIEESVQRRVSADKLDSG